MTHKILNPYLSCQESQYVTGWLLSVYSQSCINRTLYIVSYRTSGMRERGERGGGEEERDQKREKLRSKGRERNNCKVTVSNNIKFSQFSVMNLNIICPSFETHDNCRVLTGIISVSVSLKIWFKQLIKQINCTSKHPMLTSASKVADDMTRRRSSLFFII